MKNIKIFFNEPEKFVLENFNSLKGITGLYYIFLENTSIEYPFGKSRLIYIGMSEKRTNGIGNRLSIHYEGKPGNIGIFNYNKVEKLLFTYLNFEMLKQYWTYGIENLESYFILDFVKEFGTYPICNNKTGYEILNNEIDITIGIDWKYFE